MFPAFIIGCIGVVQIFLTSNIAIIACAPPSQSGIVGAVFNAALQLGAAVGSAAITSIQQNVDDKQPNPETTYKGRQAGFWFLVAVIIVEMIAFVIFYRTPPIQSQSQSMTETLTNESENRDESESNADYPESKDIEKQMGKRASSKDSVVSSVHANPANANDFPTEKVSEEANTSKSVA